eukprot:TRINITY_DN2111_c0_g2_i1.p1 TRINITY_DN2111_c0_g2~~TRINITY_DN2111_c0_g2_i1.p1  ORF type:complete len:814 (+),score=269.47 TRINITY_DN2111_c0_g2_i1:89-2530(+)
MSKTYLRYQQNKAFGVINSPQSNIIVDQKTNNVVCGALESVKLWNYNTEGLIKELPKQESKGNISQVSLSSNKMVAAGFTDGFINLWEQGQGNRSEFLVGFNGHQNTISSLAFNKSSTLLASGSKDTEIVIWNVVGQAGECRLRGHSDEVTALAFFGNRYLISASKDTFIKIWDLELQQCIETFVGHRCEIWSLALKGNFLFTGSSDNQLRMFEINREALKRLSTIEKIASGGIVNDIEAEEDVTAIKALIPMGAIARSDNNRVATIRISQDGSYLGCQTAGKTLDFFKIRNSDELDKRLKRKIKRRKQKIKTKVENGEEEMKMTTEEEDEIASGATLDATDYLQLLTVLRTKSKMRSFDFGQIYGDKVRLLIALRNNQVESWDIDIAHVQAAKGVAPTKRFSRLHQAGHRGDIRAIALSTDDTVMITSGPNTLKLWNVLTKSVIKTIDVPEVLSAKICPGDKHALVGDKKGMLHLIDVQNGEVLDQWKEHEGPIWSIDIRPDQRGFVTGSADKTVKFWDFELVDVGARAQQLSCSLARTLKMSDDVLCVKYSHHRENEKLLLAVSLLDSTVKVFFEDSLKFLLSLYGHKLPVMSMDISSDNHLIVTASADKNVKIWGLQFGDCHKSLFAHSDSITNVGFVWDTHYFFTASKDGEIKQYDADHFTHVQTLKGHTAEIWSLAVSRKGDFLVSGSHDRSMRIWERTEEIVFIEAEERKRLEEMLDEDQEDSVELAGESTALVGTAAVRAAEQLLGAMKESDTRAAELKEHEQDMEQARQLSLQSGEEFKPEPVPKGNPVMLGAVSIYIYCLDVSF